MYARTGQCNIRPSRTPSFSLLLTSCSPPHLPSFSFPFPPPSLPVKNFLRGELGLGVQRHDFHVF